MEIEKAIKYNYQSYSQKPFWINLFDLSENSVKLNLHENSSFLKIDEKDREDYFQKIVNIIKNDSKLYDLGNNHEIQKKKTKIEFDLMITGVNVNKEKEDKEEKNSKPEDKELRNAVKFYESKEEHRKIKERVFPDFEKFKEKSENSKHMKKVHYLEKNIKALENQMLMKYSFPLQQNLDYKNQDANEEIDEKDSLLKNYTKEKLTEINRRLNELSKETNKEELSEFISKTNDIYNEEREEKQNGINKKLEKLRGEKHERVKNEGKKYKDYLEELRRKRKQNEKLSNIDEEILKVRNQDVSNERKNEVIQKLRASNESVAKKLPEEVYLQKIDDVLRETETLLNNCKYSSEIDSENEDYDNIHYDNNDDEYTEEEKAVIEEKLDTYTSMISSIKEGYDNLFQKLHILDTEISERQKEFGNTLNLVSIQASLDEDSKKYTEMFEHADRVFIGNNELETMINEIKSDLI